MTTASLCIQLTIHAIARYICISVIHPFSLYCLQGCWQLGKAISVPPTAILGGLLILTSFVISPAVINVPKTDWIEPTLIWLTINMPTGSRKTTVYQLLLRILQQIRQAVNLGKIWLHSYVATHN